MTLKLPEMTDASFSQDVLQRPGTTVVEFWAPWCAPCRTLEPQLHKLSVNEPDWLVGKVNIDDNPRTTVEYEVMSVPTIIVFRDGQKVAEMHGPQSAAKIAAAVHAAS